MELGNFLLTLPDESPVTGYMSDCKVASDSVTDQMEFKKNYS